MPLSRELGLTPPAESSPDGTGFCGAPRLGIVCQTASRSLWRMSPPRAGPTQNAALLPANSWARGDQGVVQTLMVPLEW